MASKNGRSTLWTVLRAAVVPRLSLLWLAYGALLSGITYGLHRVGFRYDDSIKDAVVWGLVAGLPIVFRFADAAREPTMLRERVIDMLRATALVEFFVNLYVFPLWTELLLQPTFLILGLLSLRATGPTKRVVDHLVTRLGWVLLMAVGLHLLQRQDIDAQSTFLSFAQPVLLCLPVAAFTYAIALVSSYELAFMRVGWKQPDRRRRLRAKAALLMTLHVRLHKIHNFTGLLPRRLAAAGNWSASRRLVRAYKAGALKADLEA